MSYVVERTWWPIQNSNIGREKMVKGYEREIRSSLLILDLNDGKL